MIRSAKKDPKKITRKSENTNILTFTPEMGDIFLDRDIFDQYIDELDFIFPPKNISLNEQVLFYTVGTTNLVVGLLIRRDSG